MCLICYQDVKRDINHDKKEIAQDRKERNAEKTYYLKIKLNATLLQTNFETGALNGRLNINLPTVSTNN